MAKDHRGRDGAALEQLLLAVDVGQHLVEQLGPLGDAGFDLFPLAGREQQRQWVNFPRPVGTLGVGVDVVGDAVLADLPLHQREAVGHARAFALGERAQEGVPVRARLARRREQLVVTVFERGVAGEQLSQHGRGEMQGVTAGFSRIGAKGPPTTRVGRQKQYASPSPITRSGATTRPSRCGAAAPWSWARGSRTTSARLLPARCRACSCRAPFSGPRQERRGRYRWGR